MFDEKSIHEWVETMIFQCVAYLLENVPIHPIYPPAQFVEANKHQLLLPQQSEPVGPVATAGCKVIISHLAESRRFTGNEIYENAW